MNDAIVELIRLHTKMPIHVFCLPKKNLKCTGKDLFPFWYCSLTAAYANACSGWIHEKKKKKAFAKKKHSFVAHNFKKMRTFCKMVHGKLLIHQSMASKPNKLIFFCSLFFARVPYVICYSFKNSSSRPYYSS